MRLSHAYKFRHTLRLALIESCTQRRTIAISCLFIRPKPLIDRLKKSAFTRLPNMAMNELSRELRWIELDR